MVSGFPGSRVDAVELGTLWVSRAVRGRGVGDRLVQEVQQWATQVGVEVLLLTVASSNEHAIALYRRNGFDRAEPSAREPLAVGKFTMCKVLRAG